MRRILFGLVVAAVALTAAAPGLVHAGPVIGPLTKKTRVDARDTDVYRVTLEGLEETEITVIGDGDTDLDLYVYDESGRLVARDDDNTDVCIVRFTPLRTGRYTIRVVNRGTVYNEYRITVR